MTLPASGSIFLSQIAGEFSISADSIFPTAFYGLGGAPASGPLSFADFYGRSGTTAGISTDNAAPTVFTFNQTDTAHITAVLGTIGSITLIAGTANPTRINPGTAGGGTATGTVNAPNSGIGSADATYRYTHSDGVHFVDVVYHAEWGT